VVIPRPVTEAALVPSKGNPHVICGGPSGAITNFLRVPPFSPRQYHSQFIHTQAISLISKGQKGNAWEPSNTTMFFRDRGALDKKLFRGALLDFKEAMAET